LGPGFWLLTPLQLDDGRVVLVNRGYVSGKTEPGLPEGRILVNGLLRLTEPHGRVLRENQPAQGLWYSRDVAAIAQARGLKDAAPFFIDADAPPGAASGAAGAAAREPVGGLTIISFPNNHLVYALTWYGLAAMMIVALWLLFREEKE
jgi:surfeit locus 1 family protein